MKRFALLSIGVVVVSACGGSDKAAAPTSTGAPAVAEVATTESIAVSDSTLNVPDDYPTIQAAVNAAKPGDLILIAPGTYNEAVTVETDNLTIRGLDRNTVILDGELKLENGVKVVDANGVAVENMTATNYAQNGFFWTGVEGYRGSYLSAYRTGDYGVYAYDSMKGQFDHIYAAGSPDAGVYIGECYPCDAVVTDVLSEHNGLGYSGTNSGGNLLIVNSVFRNNRAGIVPNSGSYELCYPERETTIVGNVVYSNNQPDTPAIDVALLAMGNGILAAGGVRNVIERNLVYDHDKTGIGLVPFLEEDPNDDLPTPDEWTKTCEESKAEAPNEPGGPILWDSQQNRVIGNVLENNRQADLVVASAGADESTLGNCFSGNTFTTTAPVDLEKIAPCDGTGAPWPAERYNVVAWLGEAHPPSLDWKTAALAPLPTQDNMPDAANAPAHPATDVPMAVDLATIAVPSKPAG